MFRLPGGDTTVRVWRASDLSFVRVLRGHRGSILCLLAVGNMLLSGARDNTIRLVQHALVKHVSGCAATASVAHIHCR